MNRFALHHGDSREVLKTLAEASVDSIVCDPPYHLTTGKKGGTGPASVNLESPYGRARVGTGFMGMTWDGGDVAHDASFWAECLRVAKPGAYLAAFGGSRTFHRLACAIEDAGWELRDTPLRGHTPQPEDCPWLLAWAYGSGFPKSHNGEWGGTALKPAWEPIVLARKPLIGTVEENWREHGTGALNIDACRIAPAGDGDYAYAPGNDYEGRNRQSGFKLSAGKLSDIGRWPANLIHDGSPEVLACFPHTTSGEGAVKRASSADGHGNAGAAYGAESRAAGTPMVSYGDTGSAARFFKSCQPDHEDKATCERLAQLARSAESRCASCGTPIAAAPVATKTSDSKSEESPATQACTGSCESCTRSPSPASAEHPASTDTTVTTASHSKSCGCARPAIDGSTNSERLEAAAGVSGLEMGTRFLYCPKASREDRNEGCEHMAKKPLLWSSGTQNPGSFQAEGTDRSSQNFHPTVKPTDLMRWLIRLVTPADGLVLDPFMGSGSTGKAAMLEGMRFVGIDLTADYVQIARARIDFALRQGHQPSLMEA